MYHTNFWHQVYVIHYLEICDCYSAFRLFKLGRPACSSTFVVTLDWGCANNISKALSVSLWQNDYYTDINKMLGYWAIEQLCRNRTHGTYMLKDTKEKYTSFLSQKTNWHITEKLTVLPYTCICWRQRALLADNHSSSVGNLGIITLWSFCQTGEFRTFLHGLSF